MTDLLSSPFAFPHGETIVGALRFDPSPGMLLRDWFAGQLAAAEVASAGANYDAAQALADAAERAGQTIPERIAFNAYEVADALLAAREPAAPDLEKPAAKPGPEWACEHGHADIFDCAECAPF